MPLKHFFLMLRQIDEVIRLCAVDFYMEQHEEGLLSHLRGRQISLLLIVARYEPCSLNDIMRLKGLSASAASMAVDKLVRSGFLSREINAANRRSVLITVKPEVHSFLADFEHRLQVRLRGLLKSCPQDELQRMDKASEVLLRHLEIGLAKEASMHSSGTDAADEPIDKACE